MNDVRDPAPSPRDETGGHFLLHLPQDTTLLPKGLTLTLVPAPSASANPATDGSSSAQSRATVVELSSELYTLLRRYIDLLDADQHGGWSRTEEKEVEAVVSSLQRAGWTIKLPHASNGPTQA
jgi:hypothetical protein